MRIDPPAYKAFAAALKDSDKDIKRQTRASLRALLAPLGVEAIREGSEGMPRRGGLRAYLTANAKASVSLQANRMYLTLNPGRSGVRLGPIDRGSLRHPAIGDMRRPKGQRRFVEQSVPSGTYTHALMKRKDEITADAERTISLFMKVKFGRDWS